MIKTTLISLGCVALLIAAGAGVYWWSNVPPRRPPDVSADAVFLWAGHLGLPAPKHGTWIECSTGADKGVNKCKLTEMNGTPEYDGIFLADTGKNPVPESNLKINVEPTSDVTNWVSLGGLRGAPLVFLKDGTVLIPKDAYQEGVAKLDQLRRMQGRKP
jgi:hypothetical protein